LAGNTYKCTKHPSDAQAPPLTEAAGEVQEKPAAARVGVADVDCQRDSEAKFRVAVLKPSVAPSGVSEAKRKRGDPGDRTKYR